MGCIFSNLAAKFAFFPPSPPTYKLHKSPDGRLSAVSSSSSSFRTSGDSSLDVRLAETRLGNKIAVFYFRNPLARLTVLYSHGNAADLGQLYDLFVQLQLNLRVNLIGYDYSGYGASTGKPSEYNTYADIEAVYECLQTEYGIDQEDLILYGQSVGSGPTLHLAAKLPRLRGVVLHSGILSGLRVLCHVKFSFCFDIYTNINKIKKVKCPVLVIHGTEDDVVNWLHGNRLWKMAKEPYEPLWIKGGGHCNLEIYPDYIRHLYRFIQDMENTNTQTRLKKIRQHLLQQERSNECCNIRCCRPQCPRCPKPSCNCKCSCVSLSCLSCCPKSSCISCCSKPNCDCLNCCRSCDCKCSCLPSGCLSCFPKSSCFSCCSKRNCNCLNCCQSCDRRCSCMPSGCFSCCPKPSCFSCCSKPNCNCLNCCQSCDRKCSCMPSGCLSCCPKPSCFSCCSKPNCNCLNSCMPSGCLSCCPKPSCFSCCRKPNCSCLSCCPKLSCDCKCSCWPSGSLSCFPNLNCFSCCRKPSCRSCCSCRPKCLECPNVKCPGCPRLRCLKCLKCPSCRPQCPKCPECSCSECCSCSGCFSWLCCVGKPLCCGGTKAAAAADEKREG